jgi:folate-binding protein YgfZ
MPDSPDLKPKTLALQPDASNLQAYSSLDQYAWLRVSGPDAEKFLQGQLTADVAILAEQQWSWAAHCNPKGRMISQFIVWRQEVWRTRDSVKFEPRAHHQQWSLHLIQCGIAELELSETEKFLPQELRLDLIGGVSFKKGCYTGQEVVARLHYRGKLKKGLFRAQCGHRLAQVGQNIRLADQIIGKIIKVTALSESSCEMLVLANIDATHDQHCKLENGGELIRWTPFAYAIPKGT